LVECNGTDAVPPPAFGNRVHGSRLEIDREHLSDGIKDHRLSIRDAPELRTPMVDSAPQNEIVGPKFMTRKSFFAFGATSETKLDKIENPVLLLPDKYKEILG
jgi:hypothetical protein